MRISVTAVLAGVALVTAACGNSDTGQSEQVTIGPAGPRRAPKTHRTATTRSSIQRTNSPEPSSIPVSRPEVMAPLITVWATSSMPLILSHPPTVTSRSALLVV